MAEEKSTDLDGIMAGTSAKPVRGILNGAIHAGAPPAAASEAIFAGAPPAIHKRSKFAISGILGWTTIAGLLLIALSYILEMTEAGQSLAYLGIAFFVIGNAFFVIAGVPWTLQRTPGKRGIKIQLLGLFAFVAGAVLGTFAGIVISILIIPVKGYDKILFPIIGFGIGGLLFNVLAVEWGTRFHSRSD